MAACGSEHGIEVAAALHRWTKAARIWCLERRDKLAVLKLKVKDNFNKALVKEEKNLWGCFRHVTGYLAYTTQKILLFSIPVTCFIWGLKDNNFCLCTFCEARGTLSGCHSVILTAFSLTFSELHFQRLQSSEDLQKNCEVSLSFI